MSIETILVIDDSALNCEIIKSNLAEAGYGVITAVSGAEAVDICKTKMLDLVLLDIVMPEIDGFETCRRIRALPQGTDLPIVFLSALKDLESHQKALDAGGDDVLTKPIHRSELIMRVRSMMWLKRLRTELRSGYNLIGSQREALNRAQSQKQELIDLIVHDLKSPLQVVLGYASQLTTQKEIAGNKMLVDLVNRIVTSAEMMQRMVINMLDISQSDAGGLRPSFSQVDVQKLLQEAIDAMSLRASIRNVNLKLVVPPNIGTIAADSQLLRRLLDNLIDNALRYSPAKGAVSVEAKDPKESFGFLELRVRDEGPGIPKEDRENIFEKYVRLSSRATGAFNYGLGLTFCRLAAQTHGGRIWIEDNQPTGSVFCVAIPSTEPVSDAGPIVSA